jgi:hypothetical protein
MDERRGRDEKGRVRDDFDAGVRAVIAAYSKPKLGIVVSGEYGCGKTAFVKAVTGYTGYPYVFDMNIPSDREVLDPDGGWASTRNELFQHDVVIDDLGAELRKHYGEPDFSEARDFICEYHVRGSGRLFITTNLRITELLDKYGGRLVDRLKDVGVPLRFYGGSKREWETL